MDRIRQRAPGRGGVAADGLRFVEPQPLLRDRRGAAALPHGSKPKLLFARGTLHSSARAASDRATHHPSAPRVASAASSSAAAGATDASTTAANAATYHASLVASATVAFDASAGAASSHRGHASRED